MVESEMKMIAQCHPRKKAVTEELALQNGAFALIIMCMFMPAVFCHLELL